MPGEEKEVKECSKILSKELFFSFFLSITSSLGSGSPKARAAIADDAN